MESFLANFHFLRPLWLLGCIPALILFGISWFMRVQSSRWNRAIDRALLPHLLDKKQGRRQAWPLLVLLLAWLLTTFSLAGPVWKKLPQPVQKKEDALVIIQDLSLSFYAQDLSPNRLTRAQHKLKDILDARKEGTTALVVYSGDAHIVAPLTNDSRTIAAMVPALSPGIMPSYGSNAGEAVETGLQLFRDAGVGKGKILLLTDEVTEDDANAITKILRGKNIILSVLGVGTEDGGPIPKQDGGFLKDERDNIIVPRLSTPVLEDLAATNGGRYREITIDDTDIEYLLTDAALLSPDDQFTSVDREFDQWEEMGPWLLLAILPLALLGFRRGWIVVIVFSVMLLPGQRSYAMSWDDFWLRKDQQGAKALAGNDPQRAAELFSSPQWKGAAEYRAGNYDEAVEAFGQSQSADDLYNRGNGLAKSGQLEEAAKAYEQALQLDPEMEDAKANRELVEKLIQQQQEQQKQQDGEGSDKDQGSGDEQQKQSNQGNDQGADQGKDQGDQSGGQDQQDQQSGDGNKQQESSGQQGDQFQGQEQTEKTSGQDDQATSESKQERRQGQQSEDSASGAEQAKQLESQESGEGPEGRQVSSAQLSDQPLSDEEQQALEQWLRQVPDDPGGLLRRKFEYQYRNNQGRRQAEPNKKIW